MPQNENYIEFDYTSMNIPIYMQFRNCIKTNQEEFNSFLGKLQYWNNIGDMQQHQHTEIHKQKQNDPGATPLMAYKLSEFNVNPLTGRVSSTLQTLIKQQAEYIEATPYDQILHWIDLAQSLGE